ncbi:MAG TPA: biotin/lipoyl-binding protein [Ohtaekwangia sp.]
MLRNWFYWFIAVLFLTMLFISTRFFKGSGHASVGITYAKEYTINAEKSAVVKSIPVVPGQEVKTGDLLVELTSQALEIDIDRLNNRIVVLRSEVDEKTKLAASEIAYMKAEQGVEIEEINAEINQAESEYQLNRQLTKEFASSKDTTRNSTSPLDVKIKALKKQKSKREEAVAIKVQDILQEKETEQRLLENQIRLLDRELELLRDEQKKLSKYAAADGVVGSVFVKQGVQVDAFTSLLSVNPKHPTTVVGYQVGKKESLPVGSEVSVQSYEHSKVIASGKVIGYGSVVELPEILQKSTAVKAFGREVFIEISAKNEFATGEKVMIR